MKDTIMRLFKNVALILAAGFFITACTTLRINTSQTIYLPVYHRIAAGPIANYSDTPLANKQVESMLTAALFAKGFAHTLAFPKQQACEKILYCPGDMPTREAILAWARKNHVRYVLTGSVNEWRYKVGLDGEPVTGVSLMLLDSQNGHVVWSGLGSAIGTSRQGLEVVGQQMLDTLLSHIIPVSSSYSNQGK